jgi:hypothetical protein
LAQEGPIVFEDQSLTLDNAHYNKEEKKLRLEKFHVKNKKITQK